MSMPDSSSEAFWRCAANSALAALMNRMAAATSLFCIHATPSALTGMSHKKKLMHEVSHKHLLGGVSLKKLAILMFHEHL